MCRVVALVAATAFGLFGAGCGGGEPGTPADRPSDSPTTAQSTAREFSIHDTDIRVAPGESFSIAVPDNASAGDDWSLSKKPAAAVVSAHGDDYDGDAGTNVNGAGGTRHFRFTAKAAGSTSLELRDCYRGCHTPKDDKRYPVRVEVG